MRLITSIIHLLFIFLVSSTVFAETIDVRQVIGDGKNGNVWKQWKQTLEERPVEQISLNLRRQKGSEHTYVNLRFEGGTTFDNQKRVPLRDSSPQTVTWNVNGEAPQGRQVVLNAYDGEVFVESASVTYGGFPQKPNIEHPRFPSHHNNSNNEDHQWNWDSGSQPGSTSDDNDALERCREQRRIRSPRIEIGRIRSTGDLFSDKYKVEGSISGICIQEAGYFEEGRLKDKIEFPLNDRFQRQEFQIKARTGRRPEIRVYSFDGGEDSIDLEDEINRGAQNNQLFGR